MKHLKRCAALCVAFVVACSAMAVPASATDYQSTYNFWNWAYDNSWFLGKAIIGFSAGNVCQVSEDGLHHATTHSGGGGSVDGQRVYKCVCDFCGQEFQAVATDLEHTYNTAVDNQEFVGLDSDGYYCLNLDWYLPSNALNDNSYFQVLEYNSNWFRATVKEVTRTSFAWRADYTPQDDLFLKIVTEHSNFYSCSSNVDIRYDVNVRTGEGSWEDNWDSANKVYTSVITKNLVAGQKYSFGSYFSYYSLDWGLVAGNTFEVSSVHPKLYVSKINQIVPELSRPSTFAPSFSYEDGDGWQVYVGLDGNKLIDETNLTYYNPVTNTTTNIQNWTYDYSDRSYTILTDSNNTTTITYGDEYITINEGDNITYNIYYYTAPDSSGDGDSSGSDGSGDDDGGGLLDKIGELIGSVLGGFIDVIGAALGKVIDSLIDLVTLTIDKLVNVINLFGSFGDALGVLWSWLPEEVVTVLVSGVTVIVFASVIKLFMR